MVQTGRWNDYRGSRGEFSHDAEGKKDKVTTLRGIIVPKGRQSAYATRKVAIVQVVQGDCFRSKVEAYSGENAVLEIVLQRGVMVE